MRKATGSCRTYSIPGKTATFVLESAMEDLPSAELQPRFLLLREGPALRQKTVMMMMNRSGILMKLYPFPYEQSCFSICMFHDNVNGMF